MKKHFFSGVQKVAKTGGGGGGVKTAYAYNGLGKKKSAQNVTLGI